MNKELFKKGVYKKYEENINNKNNEFYNTHYFTSKVNHKYNFTKIAATILISSIATMSMVYAGVSVLNYHQQKTKTNFEKNINYDYSQDMNYQDGIYYKKITSYNEYIKDKQRWNDLIEMTEDDFNNYFIIITAVENTSMTGLTVSNITTDNDNLYIELFQNTNNSDLENNILSIKIPTEDDRNTIIFKKAGYQPNNNEYKELSTLSSNYTKEQAINDNCYVIEDGKVISNNKEQLDEFIENSKQDKTAFIRIVSYDSDGILKGTIITDVEYKNAKYYICRDTTRLVDDKYNKKDISYHEGINIIQTRKKDTQDIVTYLEDAYCNQFPICNLY